MFILRVEDTARERSTPQAVQVILDGIRCLGLDADEGPFDQAPALPALPRGDPAVAERGQGLAHSRYVWDLGEPRREKI